ncbi:MAG TPA: hypothetical protein PLV68_17235, partial [Ilumatobacteraceae bacterium]|nr:hypothetical protein [Ilumatobacteraceae bacterium]
EPVCLGFDGSDSDDWTAIRAETLDGFQFTPTYGPDRRPTYWAPEEWPGHRIPRHEVHAAMAELFDRYAVERAYCDPHDWQTEIEGWALRFGEEHVFRWDTGRGNTRVTAVWYALERFKTDLATGVLTHDGCPMTAVHMRNTRKVAKPGEKYTIGKPAQHQKIDLAMTSVLCHEAACDARSAGWTKPERALTVVWR